MWKRKNSKPLPAERRRNVIIELIWIINVYIIYKYSTNRVEKFYIQQ